MYIGVYIDVYVYIGVYRTLRPNPQLRDATPQLCVIFCFLMFLI